jgi:hypothetical protein
MFSGDETGLAVMNFDVSGVLQKTCLSPPPLSYAVTVAKTR